MPVRFECRGCRAVAEQTPLHSGLSTRADLPDGWEVLPVESGEEEDVYCPDCGPPQHEILTAAIAGAHPSGDEQMASKKQTQDRVMKLVGKIREEKKAALEKFIKDLPKRMDDAASLDGIATNAERAEWARIGVETFAHSTGVADEERELQVADLLADIMHLCDAEDVSFDGALDNARGHYEEELADEAGDMEDDDEDEDEGPAAGGSGETPS